MQLTKAMDECLVDKDLYSWIMASFSTTTPTDTVTAAIIMMGSMQKYFGYTMSLICGIPSVTFLGEKARASPPHRQAPAIRRRARALRTLAYTYS
jgi:hypothetical protein